MAVENTVTVAGFWLGALLPVAYLPLFISGVDSFTQLVVLLALLGLNIVALIVGHEHRQPNR